MSSRFIQCSHVRLVLVPHLVALTKWFFCGVCASRGGGGLTFVTGEFKTLTSVGYLLRCGLSYPAVGPCYHEGSPTQVNIQVCRSKMLCCSFIATPVKIKEHHSGYTTHTEAHPSLIDESESILFWETLWFTNRIMNYTIPFSMKLLPNDYCTSKDPFPIKLVKRNMDMVTVSGALV